MAGVVDRPISQTPLAVVDLETTGLYPGGDKIVEVAAVRMDPGAAPVLSLDTLVNPRRSVSATEIHGITDADVVDAPTFDQIAGNLASALADSVFASYNVYFDAKFLQAELQTVGVEQFPPHLCLMYMRPLLGVGSKCSLADACQCHGVAHTGSHWAAADALAAARLWQVYLVALDRLGLRTFRDLACQKAYKFTRSFSYDPFDRSVAVRLRSTQRLKSRRPPAPATAADTSVARQTVLAEYWDALTATLADLDVTTEETSYLLSKQKSLHLSEDELRWLHARAFAGILADVCQDKAVTRSEAEAVYRVSIGLRRLGWAPGDSVAEPPRSSAAPAAQAPQPTRRSIRSWFGGRA